MLHISCMVCRLFCNYRNCNYDNWVQNIITYVYVDGRQKAMNPAAKLWLHLFDILLNSIYSRSYCFSYARSASRISLIRLLHSEWDSPGTVSDHNQLELPTWLGDVTGLACPLADWSEARLARDRAALSLILSPADDSSSLLPASSALYINIW